MRLAISKNSQSAASFSLAVFAFIFGLILFVTMQSFYLAFTQALIPASFSITLALNSFSEKNSKNALACLLGFLLFCFLQYQLEAHYPPTLKQLKQQQALKEQQEKQEQKSSLSANLSIKYPR